MRGKELAAAMQRTEATMIGNLLRPGSVRRVGGAFCLSFAAIDEPFVNRAVGFGTLAPASQSVLDRIVRFYERAGTPPRVTLAGDLAPRVAYRLLERSGFVQYGHQEQIHLYDRRRPPEPRRVDGLSIDRVRPSEAKLYADTASTSFSDRGPGFRNAVEMLVRRRAGGRTVMAFLGRIEGAPAATGMLTRVGPIGGLGNGSVLPAFRGRGIQTALIAHRMRYGWERGLRLFFGQTMNPASAHNLDDLGWRLLYVSRDFVKQA